MFYILSVNSKQQSHQDVRFYGSRKIFINFIEEQFKDQKYQLHFYYNKFLTSEEQAQILIQQPQLIILCDRCERKLNKATSILLFLTDQTKELCITCFLKMPLQNQRYYYQMRQNINVCITEEGWSMISELLLLNALQIYGFGNWGQVKNYMDYHCSNFTQKQLQEHYLSFYLTNNLEPIFSRYPMQMLKENKFDETRSSQMPVYSQQNLGEYQQIQAYNQKRQQHIYDYDPSAEQMICDLEFSRQDSVEETELKYLKIEAYNQRIKERKKRQKFVIQHKLLSQEYARILLSSGLEKISIRQRMGCFSRFQTYDQAKTLVSCLTLHSTLKATIKQLAKQRFRLGNPTFQAAFNALSQKKLERSLLTNITATQLKTYFFQGEKCNKRLLDEESKRQTQSLQLIKKRLKGIEMLDQNSQVIFYCLRKH